MPKQLAAVYLTILAGALIMPALPRTARATEATPAAPAPANPLATARPAEMSSGLVVSAVAPVAAEQWKLPPGVGLIVDAVDPQSPAAAAGVRASDVLVRLDDQILVSQVQFLVLVRLRKPKDRAVLTLLRDGVERKVALEFPAADEARPDGPPDAKPPVPRGLTGTARMMSVLSAPDFAGGAVASSSVTFSDADHTLIVTSRNSVAPNLALAQRKEKLAKLEEELRGYLQKQMTDKHPKVQPLREAIAQLQREIAATPEEAAGGRYLLATDRRGLVLFEGPIDSEDHRKEIPPAILRKLQAMEGWMHVQTSAGGGRAEAQLLMHMSAVGAAPVPLVPPKAPPPPGSQDFSDEEHNLLLVTGPAGRRLVAHDKLGHTLFDGPVETDADRLAVPPDVLRKLEAFEKANRAEVSLIEDGVTLTIVAERGHQRVTARDAGGKTLFDGPIDTEEERAKMPDKVRAKVERLWKSCATVWEGSGG